MFLSLAQYDRVHDTWMYVSRVRRPSYCGMLCASETPDACPTSSKDGQTNTMLKMKDMFAVQVTITDATCLALCLAIAIA
jgi:hypothetical protein